MTHPHAESVLNVMNEQSVKTAKSLSRLSELGLVEEARSGHWSLTERGQMYVEQLIKDRFYLDGASMHQAQIEIQLIAIVVAACCALPGVFLVLT